MTPCPERPERPFGHKDRGASLLLTFRGVLLHPLCQHPTFHHRPEFTARENFPSKSMHQGCAFNRGFFLVIIILQLNLRSHKSKDMNGHDPTYFCMASSLTQPGYSRPSICVQIAFLDLQRYYQTSNNPNNPNNPNNESNERLSSPQVPQSKESEESEEAIPLYVAFNTIFFRLRRHGW